MRVFAFARSVLGVIDHLNLHFSEPPPERNPNAYEFAFVIRRAGAGRPWKPHAAFRFLRDTIGRCIEEKRFCLVNVDTATQAIWAAVHGVTSLLIARPNFPWVDPEELSLGGP